MDYNDDVKYPITCKKAVGKGIRLNTIQCGNDPECTKYWKDIARLGSGAYVAIPLEGGVRKITTPHDKRLAEINGDLVRLTLLYGPAAKRETDSKKLDVARALATEVAADRAGYLAKEGKTAAYDLLDNIRAGKVKLESLRVEDLPADMQKMTAQERRDYLAKVARTRTKLLQEAYDLDRQRNVLIGKELNRNKDSFDSQVLEMLRKQASKHLKF
jgi:hypothetical protein